MSDINNPSSTIAAANPYAAPKSNLTPTQPDGEPNFAHRGRRLGAALIDGILMMIVLLVPLILYFGGFMAYSNKVASSFMLQLGITLVSAVIYLLINGYFLMQNGQSIGKKILGIKIVRTDGSKADLARIALRRFLPVQLVSLVPYTGGLLSIVDALFIFRKSNKCLHDDLADTIVVNV